MDFTPCATEEKFACRYCGGVTVSDPCHDCYEDELSGKDLEDQLEEMLK